jgi:hypothetical protein
MDYRKVAALLGAVPRVSAKDYYYLRNIYAACVPWYRKEA